MSWTAARFAWACSPVHFFAFAGSSTSIIIRRHEKDCGTGQEISDLRTNGIFFCRQIRTVLSTVTLQQNERSIILHGGFFWRHFNPLSLHVVIRRSSEEKDPPPSNLFTPLSHLARCGAAGYAYARLDSVSAHDPGQRGRQQPAPRGTSLTCPGRPLRHPPVGLLAPCRARFLLVESGRGPGFQVRRLITTFSFRAMLMNPLCPWCCRILHLSDRSDDLICS